MKVFLFALIFPILVFSLELTPKNSVYNIIRTALNQDHFQEYTYMGTTHSLIKNSKGDLILSSGTTSWEITHIKNYCSRTMRELIEALYGVAVIKETDNIWGASALETGHNAEKTSNWVSKDTIYQTLDSGYFVLIFILGGDYGHIGISWKGREDQYYFFSNSVGNWRLEKLTDRWDTIFGAYKFFLVDQ